MVGELYIWKSAFVQFCILQKIVYEEWMNFITRQSIKNTKYGVL